VYQDPVEELFPERKLHPIIVGGRSLEGYNILRNIQFDPFRDFGSHVVDCLFRWGMDTEYGTDGLVSVDEVAEPQHKIMSNSERVYQLVT